MKNMKMLSFNSNIMGLGLLVLLLFPLKSALGGTIISSLPGYGDLPFTLETGYVAVGENKDVQLFYYFVESQGSPEQDPLMLLIPEGPGCTGLAPFLIGKGPLTVDTVNYTEGSIPNLLLNPSDWTQGLNIIFLDAPVGTGFSYSTNLEDYNNIGDFTFANHTYEFLVEWLKNHKGFSNNQLYVAGEGYAGMIVPLVVDKILNGNEIQPESALNIKGYVLGNPGTDKLADFNAQTTFAYRLGLVPDQLYEEAYISCDNGNFTTDNPSEECTYYNDQISQLLVDIKWPNILQPLCRSQGKSRDFLNLKTDDSSTRRYLKEKSRDYPNLLADAQEKQCDNSQMICTAWANYKVVQDALHVQEGTINTWSYCSNPNYTRNVATVVDYHRNFTITDLQALIYSGDHDMAISYIGTQQWIRTLELPLIESWTPWSIDNEVAGFTKKFTKDSRYNLTYATVKGAGHFSAQDNPRECFNMVQRWIVNGTLSLNLS